MAPDIYLDFIPSRYWTSKPSGRVSESDRIPVREAVPVSVSSGPSLSPPLKLALQGPASPVCSPPPCVALPIQSLPPSLPPGFGWVM